LVDQYDKAGNISYTTFPEKWHAMQWLAFQISGMFVPLLSYCPQLSTCSLETIGQGPYTGQATRFSRFHPDPLPSATARYVTEIVRVISVLNEGLQRNNTGWLVGDKCTFADLAFRTWAEVGEGVLREQGKIKEVDAFGKYKAWIGEMDGMKEVRRVMEKMEEGRKTHGLA
jgi:glutathione S-transferase